MSRSITLRTIRQAVGQADSLPVGRVPDLPSATGAYPGRSDVGCQNS
jgi:hypothetical protein